MRVCAFVFMKSIWQEKRRRAEGRKKEGWEALALVAGILVRISQALLSEAQKGALERNQVEVCV